MTEKQEKDPKRGTDEYERLVQQEELILEATELIYSLMEKTGTSKADLARKLDRTKGYVTQVLAGSRNMTLRTLADFGYSLGYRITIDADISRPVFSYAGTSETAKGWRLHLDEPRTAWTFEKDLPHPPTMVLEFPETYSATPPVAA